MILKNFYYGSKQVIKIMQNGKVLWSHGDILSLMSAVMSYSTTSGTLNYLVMIPVSSKTESTSDGSGYARAIPVFTLFGKELSDSYGAGLLHPNDVVNLHSIEEENSYSEGFTHVWLAVNMKSDVSYDSDAEGEVHANPTVPMSGEAGKIYHSSSGVLYALFILPIEGTTRSTFRIGDAVLHAANMNPIEGEASFAIDNGSLLRLADVLNMYSESKFNIGEEATMNSVPALSLDGKNENYNYTVGAMMNIPMETMNGGSASESETTASMKLWYLPLKENDTLYVRQAYSATVNNGILEVI